MNISWILKFLCSTISNSDSGLSVLEEEERRIEVGAAKEVGWRREVGDRLTSRGNPTRLSELHCSSAAKNKTRRLLLLTKQHTHRLYIHRLLYSRRTHIQTNTHTRCLVTMDAPSLRLNNSPFSSSLLGKTLSVYLTVLFLYK